MEKRATAGSLFRPPVVRVRSVGLANPVVLVLDGDDRALPFRSIDEQPRQLLVKLGLPPRLTVAPISRSPDY